jgi:hypothetical protein
MLGVTSRGRPAASVHRRARLFAGSGEIESAHRYVAQKRLKLPGAWWLVEHAEHMLALRINRLNGEWEDYWAALAANPPANLNRGKVSPEIAA